MQNDQSIGFQNQKGCKHHTALNCDQLLRQWYLGCSKSILPSRKSVIFREPLPSYQKSTTEMLMRAPKVKAEPKPKKVRTGFTVGLHSESWVLTAFSDEKKTSEVLWPVKNRVADNRNLVEGHISPDVIFSMAIRCCYLNAFLPADT